MHAKRTLIVLALIAPVIAAYGQDDSQPNALIDEQPLAADASLEAMLGELDAPADIASLLPPDFGAIASHPARHRGESFHLITGPATRVAERAFGVDGLSAWQFASPEIDAPVLLLIHEPQGATAPGDRVSDISIAARFYKTAIARMRPSGPDRAIRLDDADRVSGQRILVFVGANPVYAPRFSDAWRGWGGAVLVIGLALMLLWLARLVLLKRRAIVKPRAAMLARPEAWNDANLPPEPAEALAELHRRAGDTMTHER